MIKQIKSSEIKDFIENNPKTVLLDVRTDDEWTTIGKPNTKNLGIKTYFITISQDPSFIENVKKEISKENQVLQKFLKNKHEEIYTIAHSVGLRDLSTWYIGYTSI